MLPQMQRRDHFFVTKYSGAVRPTRAASCRRPVLLSGQQALTSCSQTWSGGPASEFDQLIAKNAAREQRLVGARGAGGLCSTCCFEDGPAQSAGTNREDGLKPARGGAKVPVCGTLSGRPSSFKPSPAWPACGTPVLNTRAPSLDRTGKAPYRQKKKQKKPAADEVPRWWLHTAKTQGNGLVLVQIPLARNTSSACPASFAPFSSTCSRRESYDADVNSGRTKGLAWRRLSERVVDRPRRPPPPPPPPAYFATKTNSLNRTARRSGGRRMGDGVRRRLGFFYFLLESALKLVRVGCAASRLSRASPGAAEALVEGLKVPAIRSRRRSW